MSDQVRRARLAREVAGQPRGVKTVNVPLNDLCFLLDDAAAARLEERGLIIEWLAAGAGEARVEGSVVWDALRRAAASIGRGAHMDAGGRAGS